MPVVVGVKFKSSPRLYYFEAGDRQYREGCGVIVETARGLEYGKVAMLPAEVPDKEVTQPLKPVFRIADESDERQRVYLESLRPETMAACAQKIEKSGLGMKLIDVEYTFDKAKLIVYFTANGRVDFRELVRELASAFRLRIELRQIGERDECKMLGGLGACGRECCCSKHLPDYAHVSIKMAKNQNLSLNPAKISGLCGRLMCCLSYENATYAEINRRMPKIGSQVFTSDKRTGTVVGLNQLKERVRLKMEENDKFEFVDVELADIIKKGCESALDDAAEPDDVPADLKSLQD
ncbi:MAG: stage 0 sporulation family protein [Clostridiales bacterium]|jgi:cell fate regulator YaaT (PSP1 superfamily)|nr:stage 0 sporulation family protein [Clostridiales bacterium]